MPLDAVVPQPGPRAEVHQGLIWGLVVILLLATGAGPVVHASDAPALTPVEELFLQAHGPIRHVVWLELPPMAFTSEHGRIVGIDTDLRALMSVRLGLEFEVVRAANLSEAVEMLSRGEADTISPVTPAESLESQLDFTTPYITGGIGFWSQERAGLETPADLPAGTTVSSVPGAVSQAWLAEHRPDLQFLPVQSIQAGLEAVRDGRASAYLGSFSAVAHLLQEDPSLNGLVPLGDMVLRADASIAVPEGNKELLSIMNKGLASVGPSDLSSVYMRWTGFDLSPTTGSAGFQVRPVHWGLLGGGLGLILLLGGAVVLLQRQVQARTAALASSEARHRTLFEEAPVGLARSGLDGSLEQVNGHLVELLGFDSREELLTTNTAELYVDPADRERVGRTMLERGEVQGLEVRFRTRSGQLLWVELSVHVILDEGGAPVGYETAVTDVTDRVVTEQELHRQAEALARSNADLERFAYVASHDLQEPIRMVNSYIQLLRDRYAAGLDQEALEFLAFAQEGAHRMHDLVRGLLAYSRLEREGETRARCDAGEVLDEVLALLADTIQEGGATVSHDPLPEILADRVQFGQVLQNLLTNAIKFAGDAPVRIHVGCEQVGEMWTFSVRDNGIGIDPEHQQRIFEIFARLHGRDTFPGTGIGLAICKRIIEAHGGSIWVESRGTVDGDPTEGRAQESGTTFRFSLPVHPEPVPMFDEASRLRAPSP